MEYNHKNVFTGKQIRSYRKKKRWMQADLAEKIGVKGNTISAYERGSVEIPYSKLQGIAVALEIKVTDLLPLEGTEETDTISAYIQEAKSQLTDSQLEFFEQLIEKALSLSESERENFFKNVRFAVEFLNKQSE